MFTVLSSPTSLSLAGYTATDAKYAQIVFELKMSTISTEISDHAFHHNHLQIGLSGK